MNNVNLKMSTRYKQILSVIGVGIDQAITLKEIISIVGGSGVEVRKAIYDLIVDHGQAIGSCSSGRRVGYFIIQDEVDKKIAVRNLTGRITHMSKRLNVIKGREVS